MAHPFAGMHTPLLGALHEPERQTFTSSGSLEQGPNPLSKPHFWSLVEHTPLEQTLVATAGVHVWSSVGS